MVQIEPISGDGAARRVVFEQGDTRSQRWDAVPAATGPSPKGSPAPPAVTGPGKPANAHAAAPDPRG